MRRSSSPTPPPSSARRLATAEWVDARGALLHEETRELLLRATKGGGESGGGYAARRQQHLLAMQGAARGALEAYDPKTSAQRLLASVHTALAQTAVLQAGAAGVSGMVAVKAASLVDLTGLLPAALLAVTGFAVLPVQRYRLQADLQQRVAELTATLDTALRGHLEEELTRQDVAAGSTAFLRKPFTGSELGSRIRELLDEA